MLVAEKGFAMLAAMFGVLYAGGYYVPIDPDTPEDRMRSIFDCLRNPAVVADCDRSLACYRKLPRAHVLLLESLFSRIASDEPPALARAHWIDANPAYVLFTSGSTGTPKGVVVSHRAIVSFIDSFVETFALTDEDRVANQAPFDFDVSVKDIYGSIASGATLVIIPRRLFSTPAVLADFLVAQRVTVMTWAVSALCLMTTLHALDDHDLSNVRIVLFSGEGHAPASSPPVDGRAAAGHVRQPLRADRDHLQLAPITWWRGAGPTLVSSPWESPSPTGRSCSLPMAGPWRVTQARSGDPASDGTSLASGYVGMPPSMAAAFVQNPCNTLFADPLYRTGDYAIVSEDGELFFRGRRDNQIKYQGHRIELEEIDKAAESVSGVTMCRSVFDAARERLYAFYVGDIDRHELCRGHEESLPRFHGAESSDEDELHAAHEERKGRTGRPFSPWRGLPDNRAGGRSAGMRDNELMACVSAFGTPLYGVRRARAEKQGRITFGGICPSTSSSATR